MSEPVAHEDFVDLVQEMHDEACAFLIVGAHALAAHGIARVTGDLDIFVRPTRENADRVVRALGRFGAQFSVHGRPKDLADAAALEEIARRRGAPRG